MVTVEGKVRVFPDRSSMVSSLLAGIDGSIAVVIAGSCVAARVPDIAVAGSVPAVITAPLKDVGAIRAFKAGMEIRSTALKAELLSSESNKTCLSGVPVVAFPEVVVFLSRKIIGSSWVTVARLVVDPAVSQKGIKSLLAIVVAVSSCFMLLSDVYAILV
jgi:hypothetical protein